MHAFLSCPLVVSDILRLLLFLFVRVYWTTRIDAPNLTRRPWAQGWKYVIKYKMFSAAFGKQRPWSRNLFMCPSASPALYIRPIFYHRRRPRDMNARM